MQCTVTLQCSAVYCSVLIHWHYTTIHYTTLQCTGCVSQHYKYNTANTVADTVPQRVIKKVMGTSTGNGTVQYSTSAGTVLVIVQYSTSAGTVLVLVQY